MLSHIPKQPVVKANFLGSTGIRCESFDILSQFLVITCHLYSRHKYREMYSKSMLEKIGFFL